MQHTLGLARPSLGVFGLGLVALLVAGCASVPMSPGEPRGRDFRVMSWNVNFGLAGDRSAIEVIQNTDVDVVLLQETNEQWHRLLKKKLAKTFPYQRHHACCRAGGLSVLSRFPIKKHEIIKNDISWFPAQRAVIKTPSGTVQTLNVHLRPPFDDDGSLIKGYFTTRSIRAHEMRMFLSKLDPKLPALVAGDFNETDGSAVGLVERDGFVSALGLYEPDADTWRWPVPVMGEVTDRLDHVFVGERLEAIDAWVIHDGNSDHFPIVVWVQPTVRNDQA